MENNNVGVLSKCLRCGGNGLIEVFISERTLKPLISLHGFCQDCRKQIKENAPDRCIECGERVDVHAGLCIECREKKILESRREEKCIICFVRPQTNEKNFDGGKIEFCEVCLKKWNQMGKTIREEDRLNVLLDKKWKWNKKG